MNPYDAGSRLKAYQRSQEKPSHHYLLDSFDLDPRPHPYAGGGGAMFVGLLGLFASILIIALTKFTGVGLKEFIGVGNAPWVVGSRKMR